LQNIESINGEQFRDIDTEPDDEQSGPKEFVARNKPMGVEALIALLTISETCSLPPGDKKNNSTFVVKMKKMSSGRVVGQDQTL